MLEEVNGLNELLVVLGGRLEPDPRTGLLAVAGCGGNLIALPDPKEIRFQWQTSGPADGHGDVAVAASREITKRLHELVRTPMEEGRWR